MQASYQKFIDRSPVLVKTNELLANHITFKVGGPADLFVEIFNKNDLVSIFELVNKLKIPHFLLGGGSNVIFSDEGFRGVVIKYANDDIEVGDLKAKIGAGCSLNKMVLSLAKEGLGGVNFLANIPGFLGGAIVGNAGCYGSEIKGVLESVTLFDKDKLKFDIVDPEDLSFGYRHSDLKSKTNLVVVEAILNLEQVNYKDV
ncbi:MAG: FAD-binding protein, partial [Patescibacteria group bacterium]|nr:FAD-binding protein [Patescibacteria group bacterium]